MVGFAVELDRLDIEVGARGSHGVLGEGEHLVGEHRAAIVGDEHQMCMRRRRAVPGAAIGLGCHRSAVGSDYADALPVPHRTDTGSAEDAGAGIRLLRVVFNDALRVRDEAYRAGVKLCDTLIQRPVITAGQDDSGAWLAGRGAQCGVGAVGQRLPAGVARLLRLTHRETQGPHAGPSTDEVAQESPAVVSAHPQRILGSVRVAGCLWRSWRGPGRLVARSALGALKASRSSGNRTATTTPASLSRSPATPLPPVEREAGVDVGITRLATIATNVGARTDVANPKYLGRKLRKLRRLDG